MMKISIASTVLVWSWGITASVGLSVFPSLFPVRPRKFPVNRLRKVHRKCLIPSLVFTSKPQEEPANPPKSQRFSRGMGIWADRSARAASQLDLAEAIDPGVEQAADHDRGLVFDGRALYPVPHGGGYEITKLLRR
jgi:hypothetical protein